MVIVPPSVTGNSAPRRVCGGHIGLFPLPIVHCYHDDRAHAREDEPRIAPLLLAASEPFHLASVSGAQPLTKLFAMPWRLCPRYSTWIETKGACASDDLLFEL